MGIIFSVYNDPHIKVLLQQEPEEMAIPSRSKHFDQVKKKQCSSSTDQVFKLNSRFCLLAEVFFQVDLSGGGLLFRTDLGRRFPFGGEAILDKCKG